jgi:hypothetical protein
LIGARIYITGEATNQSVAASLTLNDRFNCDSGHKRPRKLHPLEVVFEAQKYDEPQMKGAYINFNEKDFVDFILSNSVLNDSKIIFNCDDGRNIYCFRRLPLT